MSIEEPLELKLILLGESGVGKTSIISRYVNDKFDDNIASSSTMSYVGKIIEKNNKKIKLNIWDTIGQEKFRAISKLFLNDTKIVILVYSIISAESFKNLDYWINLYKEHLEEDTILGVVANKSDLFLNQEVSDEEGMEYAKKNGAIFGLISAKQNKAALDKFIDKLVDAYLEKNKGKTDNENVNVNVKLDNQKVLNKNNDGSGGSCCSGGNSKIRQKKYEFIKKNYEGNIPSVFLGEKGVGKTSIIKRIKGEEININEEHTEDINKIPINYINKEIKLKLIIYDVDNEKMKTKEFIEIIRNGFIFFVVYDVNNEESLDKVRFWIEVIKKCKEEEKNKSFLLYVIGNKNDISQEKDNAIDTNDEKSKKKYIDEGQEISNEYKAIFKDMSALENRGIDDIVKESIENYLIMK